MWSRSSRDMRRAGLFAVPAGHTLTLKGTANGDMVDFEGTALQLPGVTFKAVLTRIGD